MDSIQTIYPSHSEYLHSLNWSEPGGMIVLYLCAQLAVLYTYDCLLISIYYRLGRNQLIIKKYALRSRYSSWPIQLVKD